MDSALESRTRPSLLRAVADPRNEPAWALFMKRYERLIRGWCRRKGLRPAAEDEVTQRVLVKLVHEIPKFDYDPQKRFRHWLRRMVENEVVSYWRESQRRPGDWGSGDTGVCKVLEGVPAPDGADVEAMVQELEERTERDRRVRAACERVRERVKGRTWQAFWLTSIEGRKGIEVAGLLGMEVTAVHQAKGRVLKMIREEIDRSSMSEGTG